MGAGFVCKDSIRKELLIQSFKACQSYLLSATFLNATFAAATVFTKSSSLWAREMKLVSNWEGGR